MELSFKVGCEHHCWYLLSSDSSEAASESECVLAASYVLLMVVNT